MKALQERLLAGDPVLREGKLDAADARAIRHRILLEARTRPATTSYGWLPPVVVASALAACLLVAITIGTRLQFSDGPVPPRPSPRAEPRQMQFASPGGTRIIWTFHQHLDL